jgi:cytochrome c oxidase assembly protein Cox11
MRGDTSRRRQLTYAIGATLAVVRVRLMYLCFANTAFFKVLCRVESAQKGEGGREGRAQSFRSQREKETIQSMLVQFRSMSLSTAD